MSTYYKYLIYLLLLLTAFAGCAKTKIPSSPGPAISQLPLPVRAKQAWNGKNYVQSQKLYQQLVRTPGMRAPQKALAWKRLALSAAQNSDYKTADTALTNWAQTDKNHAQNWQWLQTKAMAILHLQGPQAMQEYLARVILDKQIDWPTKLKASQLLLDKLWQKKQYEHALNIANELYAQAPTAPKKLLLQNDIISRLQQLPLKSLQGLQASRKPDTFPGNCLLAVLTLKQLEQNEAVWPQAYPVLQSLQQSQSWAQNFPFAQELKELEKLLGQPGADIGLLLPLSGKYSALGWKIARGASIAQKVLLQSGFMPHIRIINSAGPNWQQSLAGLPAKTAFIGGPLRKEVWEELQNEQHTKRAFLAFMSQMEGEGRLGWRFFSSLEDQVDSLILAAKNQLAIKDFAILYPKEKYGTKMSQVFWQELKKHGLELKAMQSYPPGDHKGWGKVVAKMLRAPKEGSASEPDFSALFIPDSFASAQLLLPNFFYYDITNMVFLGSQLWGQTAKPVVDEKYFRQAFFPGAWWQDNPSQAVSRLKQELDVTAQGKPDFWVALGYDFVRFASLLGSLPDNWTPALINTRLASRCEDMDWTLAPMSWDEQGRARQNMFLFKISKSGMYPANIGKMGARLEHIKEFAQQGHKLGEKELKE